MKEVSTAFDMASLDGVEELGFEDIESNDDRLLEEMRIIVKDYVQSTVKNKQQVSDNLKTEYVETFNKLRAKLHDELLREYSSFEFMEKLYTQEYLLDEEVK